MSWVVPAVKTTGSPPSTAAAGTAPGNRMVAASPSEPARRNSLVRGVVDGIRVLLLERPKRPPAVSRERPRTADPRDDRTGETVAQRRQGCNYAARRVVLRGTRTRRSDQEVHL